MTKFFYHTSAHVCAYTLLLILIQHTGVTLANHERTCDFQSRPHHRGHCGSNLSNLLYTLCGSISDHLFSNRNVKRHADRSLDENLRSIMMNKKDAFSYLAKRETTGSITCECCYNPCTVYELLQYCELPSS